MDPPGARLVASDFGSERSHRRCGAKHIIGLEEAIDARFADGQRAKDERSMRDGLVARYDGASAQGAGTARPQGFCG
jgi:hypothetical protein